jgi:glycosyltransferase involved in cell wall biosynthesis
VNFQKNSMPFPFLSVIIPTYNRADLLIKALHSLLRQTFPIQQFEVLVVDNGSTDNTREIVRETKKKLVNLHYYFIAQPGLHAARHLGMEKAQSDILVYTDDDIEALPTWLEGIAESFSNTEVVLVGGKCLPLFETQPPDWLQILWQKDVYGGHYIGHLSILDFGNHVREISPNFVIGCNLSIRKTILQDVGGFHPDAMPPDLIRYRGDGESWVTQCVHARGGKIVFNPKASLYHWVSKERMTRDYFSRRSFLQGISQSYQQIRRKKRVDCAIGKWLASSRKIKKLLKWLLFMEPFPGPLERLINHSLKAGYSFHQKQVATDPSLLHWVLQENYLNNDNTHAIKS